MKRIFTLSFYTVASVLVFFFIADRYIESNNQNTDILSTPTRSAVAFEWEKSVNIYVPKRSDSDCSLVYPVSRKILNAETLGPGSLEALFLGVTDEEEKSGYMTSIPKGVLVQKFEIQDKTAYVDVSAEFASGVKNKCRKEAVNSQIFKTLSDLRDIDKVVLSVDSQVYMRSD